LFLGFLRRSSPFCHSDFFRAQATGARRMIEQYVEAGLSKFVVRPATRPEPFGSFTDGFVRELMPLQN
jgi:hypothetical protein